MLYLIGIGLADEQDIAIKGLGIVRRCQEVYMEDYTSIMQVPKKQLEEFYGSKIISAPRDFVENQSDLILKKAKIMDIALLVVGDPLMATTHTSLLLDAKKQGVPFKVVHNASVLNAVAQTGLQIYKFGKIASIPFHESDGPYQVLEENHKAGSHTLFLLDLDPKNNSDSLRTIRCKRPAHPFRPISPDITVRLRPSPSLLDHSRELALLRRGMVKGIIKKLS